MQRRSRYHRKHIHIPTKYRDPKTNISLAMTLFWSNEAVGTPAKAAKGHQQQWNPIIKKLLSHRPWRVLDLSKLQIAPYENHLIQRETHIRMLSSQWPNHPFDTTVIGLRSTDCLYICPNISSSHTEGKSHSTYIMCNIMCRVRVGVAPQSARPHCSP